MQDCHLIRTATFSYDTPNLKHFISDLPVKQIVPASDNGQCHGIHFFICWITKLLTPKTLA
jgi:hypothetical protein